MDVLWSAPGAELTGRAVADRLGEYAYTTVATVLDRLAQKGEVRRRTDGRVKLYAATGTAATHVARAMRDALATADDPLEALRDFVTSIPVEQLEILRTALRRAGRRGPLSAS